MNDQPIGILDSGIGGLTIWQEIVAQLPNEAIIYAADSKNCPYGKKTPEEIHSLATKLIQFLLLKQVKLIVVGCNTITVSCLDRLRKEFPQVPILGTVPVVKSAAEQSLNRRIGILSTLTTSASPYQKQLIKTFASDCEVTNIGTDKLVPLVEVNEVEGKRVRKVLQEVLQPFKKANIDVLALGCTHFPFLKARMQEILGEKVLILDSAAAITRQVQRVLGNNKILAGKKVGFKKIYTTGEPQIVEAVLDKMKKRSLVDQVEQLK